MPTLPLTSLGTPIVSDRLWATGLSPRDDGGWNWIGQFYQYPQENPSEWVVIDLETGAYQIYEDSPYTPGTEGRYANASGNFNWNHQLRAPSGRIFWPANAGFWWYYEPADGSMHLEDIPNNPERDTTIYSGVFDVPGATVFWGTLGNKANNGTYLPQVVAVDPTTLAQTQLGRVGSNDHTTNAYAYFLHPDGVPGSTTEPSDWIYALVGEDIWDVVATQISTKTSTVLAQALTNNPFANFLERPEGLVVELYTNKGQPSQTLTQYWLVDGALYPYSYPYNPADLPFSPRTVTPYVNPLVQPPQVNTTPCPFAIQWRPYGSGGAYTRLDFSLEYIEPVLIDNIATLSDGSILIIASQYQGWARYVPPASQALFLGAGPNVSSSCFAPSPSLEYVSGYPNGILFAFDPTKPYDGGITNPVHLGAFSDGDTLSGVKYATALRYDASNARLYMDGARSRSGFGAGIGDYNVTSKVFGGTFAGLSLYTSGIGLALLGSGSSVALGGKTSDGSTAQIFLYDLNLNLTSTQTPNAAWSDTGRLYPAPDNGNVVVGISATDQVAYRWNTSTQTLLATVNLSGYGTLNPPTLYDNGDGTVSMQLGNEIVTLDLTTLVVTVLGTLPAGMTALTSLAISGGIYYTSIGSVLYKISNAPVDYSVNLGGGAFQWTGSDLDLETGDAGTIIIGSGSYEVSGSGLTLIVSFDPELNNAPFIINGNDLDIIGPIIDPSDVSANYVNFFIENSTTIDELSLRSAVGFGPLRNIVRAGIDGYGLIAPGTSLTDAQTRELLLSDGNSIGNRLILRAVCQIDPGWTVDAFSQNGNPALSIVRINPTAPPTILTVRVPGAIGN